MKIPEKVEIISLNELNIKYKHLKDQEYYEDDIPKPLFTLEIIENEIKGI